MDLVRVEVFRAVMTMMRDLVFRRGVNWLVERDVSEKRAVKLQKWIKHASSGLKMQRPRFFSPEETDCVLLRKVGFYQPVHVAPKPKEHQHKV
jgi:hypothetical protein